MAEVPKVSPVLAIIDRMMAAPAVAKTISPEAGAPTKNPHAGAASTVAPSPVATATLPQKGATKDPLDATAELFKTIFKGDIVP